MATEGRDEIESDVFASLAVPVREWIAAQGWAAPTEIQRIAIPAILQGEGDYLLCSPTASGKTEAAFLPVISRHIVSPADGVFALCVSPLKALIDDLHGRLGPLGASLGIEVHRRHGDVTQGERARFERRPTGVLLITPESLEGMLLGRETQPFRDLRSVIVDELHAFIGTERGVQLRCQLARLESLVGRRVMRIGLSATLAQPDMAARFLRSDSQAVVLETRQSASPVIQIRGFAGKDAEANATKDLFDTLRGGDHLVFDGSRGGVEVTCDRLNSLSQLAGVANEFHAHHGSLSKEVRTEAEGRLRAGMSATIVCTSTLELGIDIGTVQSIAQLGPPPSVASLRQRLGRSGRRGEPSMLRLYVSDEPGRNPSRLDADILQSIAMVELLLQGWCEPPQDRAPHYSTLVQQVLSLIKQRGSVAIDDVEQLAAAACLEEARLAELIEALRERDLVDLRTDNRLVLGLSGLTLVSDPRFVVSFDTPEEYRLMVGDLPLGAIPTTEPPQPGEPMLFAGKRWRVEDVDHTARVIRVVPGPTAELPRFSGEVPSVHRVVRERMFALRTSGETPSYLDSGARAMLRRARSRLSRSERTVVARGSGSAIHHWSGDREAFTLAAMLRCMGPQAWTDGFTIASVVPPDHLLGTLSALVNAPDPESVARAMRPAQRNRFDWLLPDSLLIHEAACRALDVEGAIDIARNATARARS